MTSAIEHNPAVTVRVPAKVNLELLVGPQRTDGFHSLSTIYQAVSLYDDVTVTESEEWSVAVTGKEADAVPADESNLAVKAARALAESAGLDEPVHIDIRKEIPVAGGMAGGSADAAAALVACHHLWELSTSREELLEIAADLGSDVPFLLQGGTAVGSGRGELLAPVLSKGTYHWVFVPSAVEGLSTPRVFREFDRLTEQGVVPEPMPSPAMVGALRSGDTEALAAVLTNDLQAAAISLRPEIGTIIDEAMSFGALGAIVSGSGPTIALLTSSSEGAIDLAVALTASGTVSDVRRAHGPVQGAHVVPAPRVR